MKNSDRALRGEFPIFQKVKSLVYLDYASTAQVPNTVLDAMQEYYSSYKSNVHRGVYKISEQATEAYEASRAAVAKLIAVDSEEVIFTSGTTDSINRVALMLRKSVHPSDEIWVNAMEHHSNLLPWIALAKEKRAKLCWMRINNGALDLDYFASSIGRKAKLVAISQMSNVTGVIHPIREIVKLAHRKGALVVVDAAQSIGHLPVRVSDLDCDFLAFSGHKMYGPMGIGVLAGKKDLLDRFDPPTYGGGMVKNVGKSKILWNDLPWKYEAGTPNVPGAIGLAAAVSWLTHHDLRQIENAERKLIQKAIRRFSNIPSLDIFSSPLPSQQGPVFSFCHPNVHPHDLATMLDRQGIAIRAGHHCAQLFVEELGVRATARLSIGLTSTWNEIEQTGAAIEQAIKKFS